ncbi:type VI secretion system secreted protein VgrG [Enterobacter sp. AG5470]|nr:type VI secretion system secreted protein VgrG [Enterobacter sp. AG5470]
MMNSRITADIQGYEGLRFWKMSGREAISESFTWTVILLGEEGRLDRSHFLGKSLSVTIPGQNLLTPRYLNGKITRVSVSPLELSGTRYAAYTLTVESDLWPMKRDRNMRIFQGKTVPEIVKEIFNDFRVNIDNQLTENYRVWEYCVQYQECSLDFVSRLMEQEGISYYFNHSASNHTLVLTDPGSQYQPVNGYEVIPYHQTGAGGITGEEGISQWALEDSITPGLYSLNDYDFRKPNAWLFQARQNASSPEPGTVDVYDWPGRYTEHGHGEKYARIHQERWQVEHQQIFGTATASGIAPGHIFQLVNAPFSNENNTYLVTEANYHFEENQYATSDSGESEHRTDFTVIPSSTAYRPERKTAWPRTYGPQTAKVVGPAGESIWTDRYGRVKVKFHWDRQSNEDDTSSCWIRVSSAWAGQGFGGVQIPRVGDEVVVDFINGDPDRPIITGRVYNESSMPPWELPAAATVMGFMTRSKNGHKDNASYLFFEDNPGNERIDLHSEKDMKVSVENDQTVDIDGCRNTTIKKQQNDDITGDATFYYRQKRTTTVDNTETNTFNNGELTTIKKGRTLNITDGDKVIIKDGRSTDVTGNETHHVSQKLTETFDQGQETTIGSAGRKETIDGGVTIDVNSGNWTQNVNNGTITIYSPQQINITSDTGINLNSPKALIQPKLHTLTITALNESFYGNNVSTAGMTTSLSLMSNTVALGSSSFKLKEWSKTVFKAKTSTVTVNMNVTNVTNTVTNITNNALFIIS